MGQLTLDINDYIEIKHRIKEKLNETVHNFITVGYYLKQVRDSGAFRRDGYRSMEEFAHAEYGLSAAAASRFMDINTEFSKNGNSIEIKEAYRGFAYSKLQEMLTVTPEDRELVTEHTTVQQIREIKKAEREERKAEEEAARKDLPLLRTEPAHTGDVPEPAAEAEPEDPFEKILTAFWREGENRELHAKAASGTLTPEILAEEICPSGSRTYRKGTDMLFFYDIDGGIKLRSYAGGSPVITRYSYGQLLERTAGTGADAEGNGQQEAEQRGKDAAGLHAEEAVATPQNGPRERTDESPGKGVNTGTEPADNGTETVTGDKHREPDRGSRKDGNEYTDEEIKHAINYFDIEYSRMLGLHQDTAKQRNYKIALGCIRRCHKNIAEQADRENYMGA